MSKISPKTTCLDPEEMGNVGTHRSEIMPQNSTKITKGSAHYVHLSGWFIMTCSQNGGDRLRQEPERSSRCMPGYLMQLVKTRRETQLPITMNWLSLPN